MENIIDKKSEALFKIFLRFLKNNNFYSKFLLSHTQFCRREGLPIIDFKKNNIHEIIDRYKLGSFRDVLLHGLLLEWDHNETELWSAIDKKWFHFYYRFKLYSNYIR